MIPLKKVLRAQPFRLLLFAGAIIFFCWPFLPGDNNLDYFNRLKILFSLWIVIILFLAAMGYSHTEHNNEGD